MTTPKKICGYCGSGAAVDSDDFSWRLANTDTDDLVREVDAIINYLFVRGSSPEPHEVAEMIGKIRSIEKLSQRTIDNLSNQLFVLHNDNT